ncbi:MAG: hypothetical protein L6Q93_13355 [Phycisphaerae bacterium]|nr:hypothetical protein [Phycisphaerae bacterium]NUQ09043.1 hypothetical protein [Phycisphaerae bacterium]
MSDQLLKPTELDSRLRFPRGRSARLARRGLIPCVRLPDGEIRFDPEVISIWLREQSTPAPEVEVRK